MADTLEGQYSTIQECRSSLNRTRNSLPNWPRSEGGLVAPLQTPNPSALLPPQGDIFAPARPPPTFVRQLNPSHRVDPPGHLRRFANELCDPWHMLRGTCWGIECWPVRRTQHVCIGAGHVMQERCAIPVQYYSVSRVLGAAEAAPRRATAFCKKPTTPYLVSISCAPFCLKWMGSGMRCQKQRFWPR